MFWEIPLTLSSNYSINFFLINFLIVLFNSILLLFLSIAIQHVTISGDIN